MSESVLFYDADCGFCRWSLAKVLSLDSGRRIRPVALQDPEAGRRLADIPPTARMTSWHLVTPDGRVHSAGRAFTPLLALLPGGAVTARLAGPAEPALVSGYRWTAARRSWWGRLVTDAARRRARARILERSRTGPTPSADAATRC